MYKLKINKKKIQEQGIKTPENSFTGLPIGDNNTPQSTQESPPYDNFVSDDTRESLFGRSSGGTDVDFEVTEGFDSGGKPYEDGFPKDEGYGQQEEPKVGRKTSIKRPNKDQTETPELEITMGQVGGNIEGSDFDANGQLNKRKKKSNKAPLGGLAVVVLLAGVGIGAFILTGNKDKEPIVDVSAETPINDPIVDSGAYVPPERDDNDKEPLTYDSDEDDEDVVDVVKDPSTMTEEEKKVYEEEQKAKELAEVYKEYLVHENTYTSFSIKYPNTWYITESVQNSFNEIKVLAKDSEFSFKTLKIEKRIDLLDFRSPSVDNTTYLKMVAMPQKDFKNTDLLWNFEIPTIIEDVQPKISVVENWGMHTLNVDYYLKREYNITYLQAQGYEKVGENILVYTFIEPFFDTSSVVASEVEEKDKDGKPVTEKAKTITIQEIKESAPNLEVWKNIVSSIEIH